MPSDKSYSPTRLPHVFAAVVGTIGVAFCFYVNHWWVT